MSQKLCLQDLANKRGPLFTVKKIMYKLKTSPEELMLYTEAQEIALALFSVYRFSRLNIGDTFGVESVLLVVACQVSVQAYNLPRAPVVFN